MNRQKLILFCLAILLALAIVWSYARMPRQKTVATLTYAPGQQTLQAVPRGSVIGGRRGVDRLRLDLLDREPSGFSGYRRNLFKPLFTDETRNAARSRRPPPPPPPLPPPVDIAPRLELARFTFLGFLKKDNRRTVFLSRDGGEIILVKKGDVFAERYEAVSITDQALTIRVADTGEEIVIPLMESAPLFSQR
jgi:hypothetical protein